MDLDFVDIGICDQISIRPPLCRMASDSRALAANNAIGFFKHKYWKIAACY